MSNENVFVKDDLLQGYYVPLRTEVICSPKLSHGAKILYAAILDYIWAKGKNCAWPSQKQLANDINVKVRTIRNYFQELKEVGLITVTRRGLSQTNVYTIHKPDLESLGLAKSFLSERKQIAYQERKQIAEEEEEENNNNPPDTGNLLPPSIPPQDDDEDSASEMPLGDTEMNNNIDKQNNNSASNPKVPEENSTSKTNSTGNERKDNIPPPLEQIRNKMTTITGKLEMSPVDFSLAKKMLDEGISVELILATIDIVAQNKRSPGKIKSFAYFKDAIYEAWEVQNKNTNDMTDSMSRRSKRRKELGL